MEFNATESKVASYPKWGGLERGRGRGFLVSAGKRTTKNHSFYCFVFMVIKYGSTLVYELDLQVGKQGLDGVTTPLLIGP